MAFEIKKNKEKWAILGSGSGWNLFPLQSDHIVFGLNDYVYTERYGIKLDYLAIMDVLDEKPLVVAGLSNLGEIIQRINAMKIPFVAPFKYAEIPLSEAFPLEECAKEFGLPYFTNTIAYMIFYAMLKGAKEIDIYGVNQASSSEYFYEKSGVEYAIGVAVGRGIKVTINGDKSELLTNKARFGGGLLYGYNQTYSQIIQLKEKFGEPIIHHLLKPEQPFSRTVRVVKP